MGKGDGPRGGEVEARGFVFAAPNCAFLVAARFPDAFLASPLRLFFIDGLFAEGIAGCFLGAFSGVTTSIVMIPSLSRDSNAKRAFLLNYLVLVDYAM